jgi:hypothetical protein
MRYILGRSKTIETAQATIGFLTLTYLDKKFVWDSEKQNPFPWVILCDAGSGDLSYELSSEMTRVCRAFLCGRGELMC